MFQEFLFLVIVSFVLRVKSDQAYFLLNAECTTPYSCIGEIHDISVVCLNSRCVCDPRLGIYDAVRFQCVGRAEHACLGNLCTRNAFCDVPTNTCKCHPGYNISTQGHCLHGHEEICEEDEDCKQGLLCFNGKCECRYPSHQYYHAGNDTCYSLAQAWDSNLKNQKSPDLPNGNSTLIECFKLFFVILQIGCLISIAIILAKIGTILKGVIGSFKLHGYFLRSGLDSKLQDDSMHIESRPFFEGGKV